MRTADETYAFNQGFTSFRVTQTHPFDQSRVLQVKRTTVFEDLAFVDTDELLFHVQANAKPVGQCRKFLHERFGLVEHPVDVQVRQRGLVPFLMAATNAQISVR